jgi:periplasmic protein TonB
MQVTYAFKRENVDNNILSKAIKFGTSASLGVIVTGMLLFLMCSLIAMNPPDIPEVTYKRFEFLMDPNRDIDPIIEALVKKPLEPEPEPNIPDIRETFEDTSVIEIVKLLPAGPVDINLQNGMESGSAIPILKVAPQYPRRAQTRGIEGYVDLMFDISPMGKTENIRVIYADPEGYFERASIKALAKWKYKAAMEDGEGQVQKNQATRIKFELNKL